MTAPAGMRIAFYAPLKPPDDPIASGDRRVAQLLFEALQIAGHQPFVASRLRTYDGKGDPPRQAQLAAAGGQSAQRLVRAWRRAPPRSPEGAPALWMTYHLFYKAPDWLGPAVSDALGIPYVVAEASHAPKRAGGPWDLGHRAVEQALRRAAVVLGLNPADRDCVLPLLREPQRWIALPPFVDMRRYAAAAAAAVMRRHRQPGAPRPLRLITVAMMRRGDKLASYRVLGAALARVLDLEWSLDVVGDGEARAEVEAALAPLGGARVRWRGVLDEAAVGGALAETDLCVWPAVNEAFGMALLEAQASGLPVVAGASGGVGGIVADGETGLLTPPGDIAAFAAAVRSLIGDDERRARMGAAAYARVRREHDLPVAAARLAAVLGRLRLRTPVPALEHDRVRLNHTAVTPARAGGQALDSRFRGGDVST